MIAIIKGCGNNIASIRYALQRLGQEAIITAQPDIIKNSSHVLLPGVGHAGFAMDQLNRNCLTEVIKNLTQPVLGICLGMQLLFNTSEEGNTAGLGIIPGIIKAFEKSPNLTIPHMGWNILQWKTNSDLQKNLNEGDFFYFVHSFKAPITTYTIATCEYGENFSAIVKKDNFYGMQFHPERSGNIGEKILKNFFNL